jgi:aspartate kinase
MSLHESGVPAISFTGSQSGIITTADHSTAKIVEIRPQRIKEEIQKGKVVIIAGFQGVSVNREITTLGRGGSDTTAVALAAVLEAEYCEVFTDVEGIFSADPRIVPEARQIGELSYDFAVEMSSMGAKMHPRSMELARKFSVPVVIKSSDLEKTRCTWVRKGEDHLMEKTLVKGVTSLEGYSYFQVKGLEERKLKGFLEKGFHFKKITIDSDSLSFLISEDQIPLLKKVFEEEALSFSETPSLALVGLVGSFLERESETVGQALPLLQEAGIKPHLIYSDTLSVCFAIEAHHRKELVRTLHNQFIEKRT